MGISRRDALKAGVAAAALGAANVSAKEKSSSGGYFCEEIATALPRKRKGHPRVVVVGGGWAGLSFAKEIKINVPHADVILVEQRFEFMSCPMSNLWLVDKIELDYLIHDYLQAARENDYTYFQASATGIDKRRKLLKTSNGSIEYDYLVLAPGIDYDYDLWTHGDKELESRLRNEYPAAFMPGSEHMTLKKKIHNFKGGTFVLTVPRGNYRCLPAPYERACLIADYFKTNGIKGKVLLLDEHEGITIKDHGFSTAFKELYKDFIHYEPNSLIQHIDPEKKIITTEFDEWHFDDAALYPPVRAGRLIEVLGLAKDTIYNRKEADIDIFTYEAKGKENKDIFVCGDARPMGFSKSGNTSNTEGKNVAREVAARILGKKHEWESPVTVCISDVSFNPERGIFIHSEYEFNPKTNQFQFATPVTDEVWKGEEGLNNAEAVYGWAESMYADMFQGGFTKGFIPLAPSEKEKS